MLAESVDAVIGVDTHTDTHTACLVDQTGRDLAVLTVEATPDGYAELLAWATRQTPGPRLVWAVEGCRSHGTGLLRVLLAGGQQVVEAGRPQRASRRPGGKSDPADARLAVRTALAAAHHAQPRRDGDREALRILLVAREHANATRTAAVNVFKSLLLTGSDQLREQLRRLSTPRQTAACARRRVHAGQPTAERVRRQTLRSLAQRIRLLDNEIRANERQLDTLVQAIMPALLAEPGVGPISAAHLLIAWSHRGRCRSEAAFGRNAAGRAEACWLPIAAGLTPHGMRHGHRTTMEELNTPAKLMDDRMGHEDGSIQSRYTHITALMRSTLMDGLTRLWLAALDARRAMSPRSPVAVLDRLLVARAREVGE
jgi:hypothetical protein